MKMGLDLFTNLSKERVIEIIKSESELLGYEVLDIVSTDTDCRLKT